MNKKVSFNELVYIKAKNAVQQQVIDLWPRSRIMFLMGSSGSGKTYLSLALALKEILNYRSDNGKRPKLILSRPTIACGDDLGFLPGNLEEKIIPWLGGFRDVLGDISHKNLEELAQEISIEYAPVQLLRGRTISNAFLIVDEAQLLTSQQLLCVLTRIGERGKIIICGDQNQSDLFDDPRDVPIVHAARKLGKLDTIAVVNFKDKDIVRDPLITDILKLL